MKITNPLLKLPPRPRAAICTALIVIAVIAFLVSLGLFPNFWRGAVAITMLVGIVVTILSCVWWVIAAIYNGLVDSFTAREQLKGPGQ